MQIKTSLKYSLFSLLILFAVINTAVTLPNMATVTNTATSALSTQTEQYPQYTADAASGKGNVINYTWCLADPSLSNLQVVHRGFSLAGKRIQGDKDLLLLHAARYSNAVKASAGDQIKFADSLTHIFLFLFPHHFFW